MANFSTGLRNKMLESMGFRDAIYPAKLRIFGGPVPADADAAETGTLLLEITSPDDPTNGLSFASPVNAVISKSSSEAWEATILAAGEMTYFRLVVVGDDTLASTTAARIQGTVGLVGADMVVTSTTLDTSQPWVLNYFNVALPSAA